MTNKDTILKLSDEVEALDVRIQTEGAKLDAARDAIEPTKKSVTDRLLAGQDASIEEVQKLEYIVEGQKLVIHELIERRDAKRSELAAAIKDFNAAVELQRQAEPAVHGIGALTKLIAIRNSLCEYLAMMVATHAWARTERFYLYLKDGLDKLDDAIELCEGEGYDKIKSQLLPYQGTIDKLSADLDKKYPVFG